MILLLRTKFRVNRTINRGDIALFHVLNIVSNFQGLVVSDILGLSYFIILA